MSRTRAAVACGLLGLVAALVVVLSERRAQIATTDRVPNTVFVTALAAGQQLCQSGEIVPAGTAALRMTIGTYGKPGPRLRIRITSGGSSGATISSGRVAPGWRQGVAVFPISRVTHTHGDSTVCVRNVGRASIAFAGATLPTNFGFSDSVDGQSESSEIRIDYMLPGRPSWFAMIGRIAYRLTLGKGSYVGWAGWIAPLLLMLAVGTVAVRVLLREERP